MSETDLKFSRESEQWVRSELETIENVIAEVHEHFPLLEGKQVLRMALAIYGRMK